MSLGECDECGCWVSGDHIEPAQAIRDWLDKERCKPSGLKPDEIALLERCAEDLE